MANAFYRSSSSSAKKNSDRERRQNSFFASEESSDAAASHAAAEEENSARRNVSSRSEQRAEGRSIFTWRANITPSALVTMSVLALVMLGFSFLSGVIVGRSSMPLPQALELDRLLAEESSPEEGEAEEPEKILPKEELRFMTSLKSDPAGGVLSESGKTTAAAPSSSPAAVVEKAKQEKPRQEVEKPREPQFDYVLRVAAFKEADQAQALLKTLTGDGFKARRTQAKTRRTTWYYVQVLMRGSKADLQVLRRKLDGYGLHDAMVISEKAVKGK